MSDEKIISRLKKRVSDLEEALELAIPMTNYAKSSIKIEVMRIPERFQKVPDEPKNRKERRAKAAMTKGKKHDLDHQRHCRTTR